ncbi:MAG: LacI family DNA-binding transcriptional regulator [Ilumatobacteraceae bacterium]
MSRATPTISEVAEHADVSVATVSRVLNDNAAVNQAMAARVRRSIEALGYRPNQVARSMRTQRSRIIAVIVPDVENPFFTSVVRGIEDEGRAKGLLTVLCNTDNNPKNEREYLRLAVDQRMDGVILASDMRSLGDFQHHDDPALTTVLVDREIEGIHADAVLVDNVLAAKEATAHLLQSGATRVACVTGPSTASTSLQRLDGYRRALADAGIEEQPALVRHADYRVAGGRAAVEDLLRGPERPDALLVCNNMMTMGAVQVLSERGVSVPNDMLLVGFDDESWSGYWRPSITTVAQPARYVGRTAMRLLLDRLEAPNHALQRVVLVPELKIRESSHR